MKKCPRCGTQYSDMTLSFCLQDGAPLVAAPQAETPTVVLGEEETIAARRGPVLVPDSDSNSVAWERSQTTHVVGPPLHEKRGSNTALAVVLTVVGMVLLFGIIGIAAIVFLRNAQQASVNNNSPSNTANALVSNVPRSTPYGAPSPGETLQNTPSYTSRPTNVASPPPPPLLASYPATKRLVFARGAYSTSFSGELNPGDTRSLVLGCRSGQSLTANVSSGGECVTVRGGGTALRTTTNGGDNYVTLTNRCSSVSHFTVTISVI